MANNEDMPERKGFTYYRSFRDAICELSIEERLQIYEAIADYALDGIDPDMSQMNSAVRMAWRLIRPYLEADRTRWENGCKGGKYGYLGGAPSEKMLGNQNARKHPEQTPKQTPTPLYNENVNVNVNDNANVRNRRFTPPSIEEVRAYVCDEGLDIDAEEFMDYGIANGWKLSNGNPMKDWRATLRQWHRRKNQQKENQQRKDDGKHSISSTLHPQMCDYGESTI